MNKKPNQVETWISRIPLTYRWRKIPKTFLLLSNLLLRPFIFLKNHDKGIDHTKYCVNFADNETVCQGSEFLDYYRVRMKMMSIISSKKEGIDDSCALIEAIKKINLMLKTLINKTPGTRIGP